jgi:hypothetical protein
MGAEKGCIYVLPVGAVTSEVQLAGQAYSKIVAIVTVGLVVAFNIMLVNISTNRARERGLTRANHIGTNARDWLNLDEELVENLIILGTIISGVEWGDISTLLLLEPGIGVGNVANY